jgi:branched-chain amino acid transport system substrate-binding protein
VLTEQTATSSKMSCSRSEPKTVLGEFAVDERGFQIGHRAITIQWQDGKHVVVWRDELAAGEERRPTPVCSQR